MSEENIIGHGSKDEELDEIVRKLREAKSDLTAILKRIDNAETEQEIRKILSSEGCRIAMPTTTNPKEMMFWGAVNFAFGAFNYYHARNRRKGTSPEETDDQPTP